MNDLESVLKSLDEAQSFIPAEVCTSKVTRVAYSRAYSAIQDYKACLIADYKAQHKKLVEENSNGKPQS